MDTSPSAAPHRLSMDSLILRTVARGLVPIITLFSVHLLLRGHQLPGGGFIAGLLTASAIIMVYLAYGRSAVPPVRQRIAYWLLASGLGVAFSTGLGGILAGGYFLKSGFRYVPVWVTASTWEFASAAVFDFGVYLVVIGVTLTILNLLGREADQPGPGTHAAPPQPAHDATDGPRP